MLFYIHKFLFTRMIQCCNIPQPSVSDLEAKLNADLQRIRDWLVSNKLTLNTTKTYAMLIGSGRKLSKVNSISVLVHGNS